MQCIILAAGEGTRMRPLTLERPKPLIEICGKPLLAHIVETLPDVVDELIIVIGYKGDMIREYCGTEFLGRKVSYVVQENPKGGTADAVFQAAPLMHGTFFVIHGDDILGREALEEVSTKQHGMLAAQAEDPTKFGVLVMHDDGTLNTIIEKPENPPSDLVNIGGFVLTTDIFKYPAEPSPKGERYLTDCVTAYAKDHPVSVVVEDLWITVGNPDDIAKAEAILCPKN